MFAMRCKKWWFCTRSLLKFADVHSYCTQSHMWREVHTVIVVSTLSNEKFDILRLCRVKSHVIFWQIVQMLSASPSSLGSRPGRVHRSLVPRTILAQNAISRQQTSLHIMSLSSCLLCYNANLNDSRQTVENSLKLDMHKTRTCFCSRLFVVGNTLKTLRTCDFYANCFSSVAPRSREVLFLARAIIWSFAITMWASLFCLYGRHCVTFYVFYELGSMSAFGSL